MKLLHPLNEDRSMPQFLFQLWLPYINSLTLKQSMHFHEYFVSFGAVPTHIVVKCPSVVLHAADKSAPDELLHVVKYALRQMIGIDTSFP